MPWAELFCPFRAGIAALAGKGMPPPRTIASRRPIAGIHAYQAVEELGVASDPLVERRRSGAKRRSMAATEGRPTVFPGFAGDALLLQQATPHAHPIRPPSIHRCKRMKSHQPRWFDDRNGFRRPHHPPVACMVADHRNHLRLEASARAPSPPRVVHLCARELGRGCVTPFTLLHPVPSRPQSPSRRAKIG